MAKCYSFDFLLPTPGFKKVKTVSGSRVVQTSSGPGAGVSWTPRVASCLVGPRVPSPCCWIFASVPADAPALFPRCCGLLSPCKDADPTAAVSLTLRRPPGLPASLLPHACSAPGHHLVQFSGPTLSKMLRDWLLGPGDWERAKARGQSPKGHSVVLAVT